MTTDSAASAADPILRVGSRRFDRLLVPIVSVFGLLYLAQCTDAFVADWPSMADPAGIAVYALLAVSVVFGLAAAVAKPRLARGLLFGAFDSFLVSLVVWPFAIVEPLPALEVPWPLAVWGFYAACIVTVEPRPAVPLLASAIVGADVGFVLYKAGGIAVLPASLAAAQIVAFTVALWTLLFVTRRALSAADRAQETALKRYAAAGLQTASEHERNRTDALVHDSVLMTFLSAASAQTETGEALAGRMAANALRMLSRVANADAAGDLVAFGKALTAMQAEKAALVGHFDEHVDTQALELVVPQPAADALIGAMVEAMDNSVRHAGACTIRSVRVTQLGHDGVRVVICDDGFGFDADTPRRAGGAVAAVSRVRAADGFARIDSAPGRGTTVLLAWGSSVTPDGAWDLAGNVALTA